MVQFMILKFVYSQNNRFDFEQAMKWTTLFRQENTRKQKFGKYTYCEYYTYIQIKNYIPQLLNWVSENAIF